MEQDKQTRALDKKAENARELGLDYEPVCKECNGSGEIETGIGMMVCAACPPAQPAPVQEPEVSWGVDWGRAGDKSCVSIIKRLPNGKIEVVAVEYEP